MKYLLAIAAFGAFVTLCQAACYQQKASLDMATRQPKPCSYKGEEHPLDSTWKVDCLECTCRNSGHMTCCTERPEHGNRFMYTIRKRTPNEKCLP